MTVEEIFDMTGVSVRETFSTMLNLEVERGSAYIEQGAHASKDGVVALVGLAGKWMGTGAISCSSELACKLASIMLMTEYPAVHDDVLDAFGELCNMIIGGFKTRLEHTTGPMGLSLPTVVFGRNFTTRSLAKSHWNVVPFHVLGHPFEVHVCLTQGPEDGPRLRQSFSSLISVSH